MVLVAVTLGAGLASAQSLIVSQGQTIAFSGLDGTPAGDVAPGLSMGERFGGPNGPNPGAIDDSGRVLFRAQLVNSAGVPYPSAQQYLSRGYFLGDSRGNLALVLRGGDPEPSGTIPGATVTTAIGAVALTGSPRISSSGLMMFGANIWGGSANGTQNDSALYAGTVGNWQILAREGDAAPGCGGATFSTDFSGMAYSGTAINAAGQIAFQSSLAGTGVATANDAAWFTGSIGNVQLMLRKGYLTASGEQVSAIGNSTHMNAAGQVLIEVTFLQGSGTNPVTALNDKALWVYTPGVGFAEILREGSAAPTPPGTFYGSPSLSGLAIFNGAGQALVGINNMLVLASPSSTSVVMQNQDAAPGVPGANFNAVTTFNMCLSDGGRVAFNATLVNGGVTTSNDSGLWTGANGNLTLVAREGDVAPGSGGQTFGAFSANIFLNAAGQVLFANALSGGANAQSMFSWDPVLGLQPVFFPNDSVEVQPGVFRTLVQVASGPNSNSSGTRPLCFANDGTVTLRPSFSDGSWGIVTVRVGSLTGLPNKISEVTGGTHKLYLNAGQAHAGQLYAVAGSASGISPGTPIGAFVVPLNIDAYTNFTLANANVGPFVNTLGNLGADGRALAQLVIPPLPGAAGLVVHHAYGVLDSFNNLVFVSEAARLEITP